MSTFQPRCPTCREPLPAEAPGGLCPRCLLDVGRGSSSSSEARFHDDGQEGAAGRLAARIDEELEGYAIEEAVGRGGMGFVFRARQLALDRVVALKVLAPEWARLPGFPERFLREARALARLDHPHVVRVHDFGTTPSGLAWLAMEYVDGTNLRHLLARGRLSPRAALELVGPICDALQAAHDLGVVHRDVKPENVLIDRQGRVKLADFGLARFTEEGGTGRLTETRHHLGTPHYMAPEQVAGAGGVDHRADIYSLGVVFYEMLTGELPIGRFPPPSARVREASRWDPVVMKALAARPEERWQKVSEVKEASRSGARVPSTQESGEVGGRSEAPAGSPSRRPGHVTLLVVLVILATLLALGSCLLTAWFAPAPDPGAGGRATHEGR